MMTVRPPAVAGMFYPSDPGELQDMMADYLGNMDGRRGNPRDIGVPKAIVVPHAGYIYSGPVAASAYGLLHPARDVINRVVLLGPSHRVPLYGLASSHATHFTTPLGDIPVDTAAIEELLLLPQVKILDSAHAQEHSLEVHLPFLQTVLSDFQLIPLVVGDASPEEVAEVLDRLWGDEHTLIVISSDLSHYHDYDSAKQLDLQTCRAIEQMMPEQIGSEQACGRNPLNGLLTTAKRRGLTVTTVDLRNSGDTAGSRDQVVGYGAWAFTEH